jgi:hypothetical protein
VTLSLPTDFGILSSILDLWIFTLDENLRGGIRRWWKWIQALELSTVLLF